MPGLAQVGSDRATPCIDTRLAAALGVAVSRTRSRTDAALPADAGRRRQQQREGYRERGYPNGYRRHQPGQASRQHEHKEGPYQLDDQSSAGPLRRAPRSHDVGGQTGSRRWKGKVGRKLAQFPARLGPVCRGRDARRAPRGSAGPQRKPRSATQRRSVDSDPTRESSDWWPSRLSRPSAGTPADR